MYRTYFLFVIGLLLFWSSTGSADEALSSALGLSMDQAKKVQDIQKKYRPQFSAKRQELTREQRKGWHARVTHESGQAAQQDMVSAKLLEELKQIRQQENADIRQVLTPAQRAKFEVVLQQRKEMVGSSRDDKHL